jgi:3-deoxy-D-manno-octulosonate 8-phosphate phosphatase (KDO 8-P phosphatase)
MNHLEKFRDIRTFIFDVDGVLTDGSLIVLENGSLLRQMNIRDGYAIRRAIETGYKVCIITGGKSLGVESRLSKLGVEDIFSGVQDKLPVYNTLLEKYQLDESLILYMGDDLPDYQVMRKVGFPCCPADAAPEIISLSRYVSPKPGGKGCVRDVIEKVLRLNYHWLEES